MRHNNNETAGMAFITPKAEQARMLREARKRMTAEFAELLAIAPESGSRWAGTTSDLMEAAHVAYSDASLRDGLGCPRTFKEIVAAVCRSLHVRPPRNPRSLAGRAARRKGVRREPLIDRYCRLTAGDTARRPLLAMVRRRHDDNTMNP